MRRRRSVLYYALKKKLSKSNQNDALSILSILTIILLYLYFRRLRMTAYMSSHWTNSAWTRLHLLASPLLPFPRPFTLILLGNRFRRLLFFWKGKRGFSSRLARASSNFVRNTIPPMFPRRRNIANIKTIAKSCYRQTFAQTLTASRHTLKLSYKDDVLRRCVLQGSR